MESSALINQLNEEVDTLRQRLTEAERLLREWIESGHGFRLKDMRQRTEVFLNQKGGDVKTIATDDELELISLSKERDDLRRYLKEVTKRAERAEAELAEKQAWIDEEKRGLLHMSATLMDMRCPCDGVSDGIDWLANKCKDLEKELATLRSVRTLTGEQLYNEIRDSGTDWMAWKYAADDYKAFNSAASRLNLRCTCEPMSGEELRKLMGLSEDLQEECDDVIAHIWPKVEQKSKPTRDELLGQIVTHPFKASTVFQLGELENHIFAANDEHSLWMVANSGSDEFDIREEAEKVAKEWLVSRVLQS